MSESAVANKLRLLKLITTVQKAILNGLISERHGRALLTLDDDQQRKMLMRIVNEKLNVRQTEDEVARIQGKPLPSEVEAAKERERLENEENVKIKTTAKTATNKSKQKKAKKSHTTKKATPAPKIKVSDPRIAMNTIKDSVKMIKEGGVKAEMSEQTLKNAYKITIKIPKNK